MIFVTFYVYKNFLHTKTKLELKKVALEVMEKANTPSAWG